MKILPAMMIAASLTFGVPAALADDIIIAPEIGVRFHDDVKMKKYKSRKWDNDLAVGTVITGDDLEYYDVPEDVVVATPALKSHRYVYLNDHVYIVDRKGRIIAEVE
jgi:hypothetical protein